MRTLVAFLPLGTARRNGGAFLSIALAFGGVACGGDDPSAPEGHGGAANTGGQSALGGVGTTNVGGGGTSTTSEGGAVGSGSTTASGGRGLGGNATAGGAPAQGGAPTSGGTSSSGGKTAGGATATGGASATAGASGSCKFLSGLNVAWVNFARDVPNPNMTTFNTVFKNTQAAGGRIIRWWFHTNGSTTPGYDSSGMAVKLPQSHIDGVKSILNGANAAGVKLVISLWSFDMLQSNAGGAYVNNQALLEKDANRQAYIDNYLTPLVTALKGSPSLYAYEIFNEPEGMAEKGWATYRTTQAAITKTVNWLAAAIHTADPSALVTNGAQTFDYCSSVSGKTNHYSDTSLRNAGGKQNGILDFYQVHYYTSNGTSNSPFLYPASHWGLDKKLVMGEFYARATDGVAVGNLYTYLYDKGYAGGWAWQYNDGDAAVRWPTMQVPMQNLISAHADVGACP